MFKFLSTLFGKKSALKKPSFERRDDDRRKNQEVHTKYGIGDEYIERRAGDDRRRDHGVESDET